VTSTIPRQRQRYAICSVDELPVGRTKLFTDDKRQIIVAHLPGDEYVALSNYCSHQGGPLSGGSMERLWVGDAPGEHRQDPQRWVLICPFHNFETDVVTGCPVAKLGKSRSATYQVEIENDTIVVYV
jgi:nitrite reductase (NADH) small subunit